MTKANFSVTVYKGGVQKAALISIYKGVQPNLDENGNHLWANLIIEQNTFHVRGTVERGESYTLRVRYRLLDVETREWEYDQWQVFEAPADIRISLDKIPPESPPPTEPIPPLTPPFEPPSQPIPEEPAKEVPKRAVGTCCILNAVALPFLALLCYLISTLL